MGMEWLVIAIAVPLRVAASQIEKTGNRNWVLWNWALGLVVLGVAFSALNFRWTIEKQEALLTMYRAFDGTCAPMDPSGPPRRGVPCTFAQFKPFVMDAAPILRLPVAAVWFVGFTLLYWLSGLIFKKLGTKVS